MKKRIRSSRTRLDRGHRSPSIYSRTEKIDERGGRTTWPIFLLIIFILVLIYIVFFSNIFKIINVLIAETKYVDRGKIENILSEYQNSLFINNNLLTYFSPGAEKKLKSLEGVKSINISKKFPNTLNISVEEKVPALSWETLNNKYLVDNDGVLFASFDEKFKDIPAVVDTKNIPIQLGKSVVSPSFCAFVNEMTRDFKIQTGAEITKIEIPEITSEIKVVSNSGWYVLFDTTRSAKAEVANLSRVITEAKAKKRRLEYVDLRIDNKIFYK